MAYIGDSRIHNVRQMYKTRHGLLPFAGNNTLKTNDSPAPIGCANVEKQGREIYGEIRHK